MALYSEKLAEEAAAQEKQQDVANEVAENKLLEEAGLEADADDNYDIEEVTFAVEAAVTAAVGSSNEDDGVIGNSGGSLGNNAPINEQSIAVARDYLAEEVADAQKDVDALKGPKLTAAKKLQSKLDAYQKAADAVEKAVVDANKAGVALAANNIDADTGKSEIASVEIKTINANGSFAVEIKLTDTTEIKFGYASDGKVTYTEGTEATLKAFKGGSDLIKSLEKIHTNLLAVPTAEAAVQAAVGPLLAAEGYSLIKIEGDSTESVEDGVDQPWSELIWNDGALTLAGKLNTAEAGDPADGAEGLALVKNGKIADVAEALYNVATPGDGLGDNPDFAITGKFQNAAILNKFAAGLTDTAAADVTTALNALSDAKEGLDAFNKAVADWKELVKLQKQLETEADAVEAAAEAVEEAEELFEDLGVQLVKAEDGVADGDVYNENDEDQLADLFVYGDKALTVENFDGEDLFYFGQSPDGSQYNLVVLGKNESITDSVGAENAFDIFAVQNGANTTLYVEQKAFAGNGSSTADLVKVELVGVTADELAFNDGFLTFA